MLYEYVSGHPIEKDVRYVPLGIIMKHNYTDYL